MMYYFSVYYRFDHHSAVSCQD